MTEWWTALGDVGQIFACIAIPATVMLLIQLVLTFIGLGGESDADTATDDGFDGVDDGFEGADNNGLGDGLSIFTLRGFITFFSVLGWVGTICCGADLQIWLTIIISVSAGLLAMFWVAIMMKWLFKLQYDGTENIKDALGVSGTVYLRIPPSRTGKGKINAIINGKLTEKTAVTDEETVIICGEEVTVVGISGEETVIVKRKNKI